MFLEHESDVLIAERRESPGGQSLWVFVENQNCSGRRFVQRTGNVQNRGLPAAGWAAQRNGVAGRQLKIHTLQNVQLAVAADKRATDVSHLQNNGHRILETGSDRKEGPVRFGCYELRTHVASDEVVSRHCASSVILRLNGDDPAKS